MNDTGAPSDPADDSAEPSDFGYVPRDLDDAVERWLPKMRRMAAYWAFPEDPDALLQEIWLELHRSWSVIIAADSPLAMALQIAKRRCGKFVRRKRRFLRWPFVRDEPPSEPPAGEAHHHDPERRMAVLQEVRLLHRIISRLGEREREAFLCRRLHGLTGEETAQVMNVTRREAYTLEEDARMKIEAEWKRQKPRRGRGNE
jgi:RNA polymerase sigma factor (sigma-70 family)